LSFVSRNKLINRGGAGTISKQPYVSLGWFHGDSRTAVERHVLPSCSPPDHHVKFHGVGPEQLFPNLRKRQSAPHPQSEQIESIHNNMICVEDIQTRRLF
jgi:hypothetical protein